MPTGTMVSNNLNIELFKTNLREAWGLEQKEYPVMYTEAFHTETSRKKFEETLSMVGIGPFQTKQEMGKVPMQNIMSGWLTRFTHVRYASGMSFSHELQQDELYGQVKSSMKLFSRSERITRELLGSAFFNSAFTGTWNANDVVNSTAQPFCSNTHKLIGNSAIYGANRPPTDMDISPTALAIHNTLIRRTVDNKGIQTFYQGSELWHPPEMEWEVAELLRSTDRPDTANRATNVFKGMYGGKVWNFLTNPYAWFVKCTEHRATWYDREPLETKDEEIPQTMGDVWFGAAFRSSCGADDWRGWVGTSPTS
jgi:hypothetical protein